MIAHRVAHQTKSTSVSPLTKRLFPRSSRHLPVWTQWSRLPLRVCAIDTGSADDLFQTLSQPYTISHSWRLNRIHTWSRRSSVIEFVDETLRRLREYRSWIRMGASASVLAPTLCSWLYTTSFDLCLRYGERLCDVAERGVSRAISAWYELGSPQSAYRFDNWRSPQPRRPIVVSNNSQQWDCRLVGPTWGLSRAWLSWWLS